MARYAVPNFKTSALNARSPYQAMAMVLLFVIGRIPLGKLGNLLQKLGWPFRKCMFALTRFRGWNTNP